MKSKIILISYQVHRAFITPIKNLSTILEGISEKGEVLITSNENIWEEILHGNIYHHHVKSNVYQDFFFRIFNYILAEIRISYLLFTISKPDDTIIYFMQNSPILPMFLSKILRMRIIWMLPSTVTINKWNYRQDPLAIIPVLIQNIGYSISDTLVVYSPLLIRDWNLEKYSGKIKIAHEHYIDLKLFRETTQLSERPNIVGYIGRMNYEKGVENFVDSLPILLESDKSLKILIGGDGPLKEAITATLKKEFLTARVDIIGWISHDDLPGYLNQLKLLVLPSYTEGLPNTMLESMACGTPVLATPVGAVPDIIRNGETGFIMENNSPQCISDNIIKALQDPNLGKIASHAKEMVEKEFNFETTVTQWKQLFEKI
jgi:glycosyltransferase involved in cell wall biosynthesis